MEVELHQPKDLVIAMNMSRLYEHKLLSRSSTIPDSRHNPFMPKPNHLVKWLTRDETDQRRKKGLCFNYNEKPLFVLRGH